MDRDEKNESKKQQMISSSIVDIDQLCHLIDENTFGLKTFSLSSSKLSSIPSYQIKAFHSSRLKRLNSSVSIPKLNFNDTENCSTLLNKFRSLSTYNLPQSRRYSTIQFPKKSIQSPSSSSQGTSANSCNVEELAAYLDNFLYLPKSLSSAAELMYT